MWLAQFVCAPQFFKTPKGLCGHTVWYKHTLKPRVKNKMQSKFSICVLFIYLLHQHLNTVKCFIQNNICTLSIWWYHVITHFVGILCHVTLYVFLIYPLTTPLENPTFIKIQSWMELSLLPHKHFHYGSDSVVKITTSRKLKVFFLSGTEK
jgi:hypothetical protein